MNSRMRWRAPIVVSAGLMMLVWLSLPVGAQAPAKRAVSYDVMDYWRSIGGTRLSNDGAWLAYSLTSQGEDGELIVRNLRTNQEFKHARGTNPQFTPDAKLMLFTIVPPRSENEQNQQANAAGGAGGGAPAAGGQTPAAAGGEPGRGGGAGGGNAARNSLGIMTLADGKVTTIERVSSFRLPEESSTWVAYMRGNAAGGGGGRGNRGGGAGAAGGGRGGGGGGGGRGGGGGAAAQEPPAQTTPGAPGIPAERRKDPGNDLMLRNLATGQETTIPEVTEFAWDKAGGHLLYATSSPDAAKDGAFLRKMSDSSIVTLKSGRGRYRSLSFDEAEKQIIFVSDAVDYEKPVAPYRVYYWKTGDSAAAELVSAATRGMPPGYVVSDNFAPTFSQDGERVNLATEPATPPPPDPNVRRPAPLAVDIWTNRDAQIQPMQRVRATQERNRNYRAIVHLSNRSFVQLAAPDLPNVNPGFDPARAIGTSDIGYQQEVSWDQSYNDVYLVDLKSGARKKILEHWGAQATLSPGGKYVMYFDEKGGHWWTYRIADGTRTNLTENRSVKFFDEGHDTPDLPGPLGTAGWTANDASVLLNDQFDIWEIRPDGTNARMITGGEGRKQRLVFRYRTFETQQRTIPTDKPMLLTTTNDDTKATGYYRVPFAAGSGAPQKIIMMDKAMGAPTKARNAETIVFTQSRFDEFPNLWVSDVNFTTPRQVTNANPQQAEFNWGKAENIKYINTDGKTLNAMLIKPENFDPTKKYPMMVYIYEELSQGLHGYRAPNVSTSVNLTRYVSNGYIVLQPDIVYETGYPGPSAMKCVIPAINTVLAQGYVDPKRVGIQGHSWGGYQITYMITQTNIFAAVQAGASVSNMISAYGGIRWGTGMVRQFQYEKTQSRIGSTPWDSPLQFIENSPIFWVERINTPYLSIHNDADDAVPWYQGIEFNMAMRRLGKEAYMFNYNGQPHGLNNRDFMKHWTVHQDEFFDHYLLGKPRPEWMDKGVSFLDRGTRDVSGLFKKAVPPPAGGGR